MERTHFLVHLFLGIGALFANLAIILHLIQHHTN